MRDRLLEHLEDGSMGRLCARSADGDINLFLMAGQVLAVRTDDDEAMLLRRMLRANLLKREQLGTLRAQAAGRRLEEVLFEHFDAKTSERITFDRMRENLGRFLLGTDVEFEEMDSLLVGHLHIGHDSQALLLQTEHLLKIVASLNTSEGLQRTLTRGGFEPNAEQRPYWTLLIEPHSVAWLTQKAHTEELDTLGMLAQMLSDGVLRLMTDLTPEEEEAELMAELERAAEQEPAPQTLEERPDEEVLDEELAMFADNDFVRGGDGDGAFSKTKEELDADRIDLTHGRDDLSDMPELVTDQASTSGVRMNFGGPRLSNDDAAKKVSVANEILAALCLAYDTQDGTGAGMSRVQLLIDGAPSQFAVLFRNARASSRGMVTAQVLIANLRKRPTTEHRRLLNKGLSNLIDRAMNMAAENIEDDDTIDAFLETCVGYQNRMGL